MSYDYDDYARDEAYADMADMAAEHLRQVLALETWAMLGGRGRLSWDTYRRHPKFAAAAATVESEPELPAWLRSFPHLNEGAAAIARAVMDCLPDYGLCGPDAAELERHRELLSAVSEALDVVDDFTTEAPSVFGDGLEEVDLREDLAFALNRYADRLALLEAVPFDELPLEATRVSDDYFADIYMPRVAVAEQVGVLMLEELLRDLEVAAEELLLRAACHRAEADRLEGEAAAHRAAGQDFEAARAEKLAAVHRDAAGRCESAGRSLTAALRRRRHVLRPPRPIHRRPRTPALCGQLVSSTAAVPLAPNAPPARATRVRFAATSAA